MRATSAFSWRRRSDSPSWTWLCSIVAPLLVAPATASAATSSSSLASHNMATRGPSSIAATRSISCVGRLTTIDRSSAVATASIRASATSIAAAGAPWVSISSSGRPACRPISSATPGQSMLRITRPPACRTAWVAAPASAGALIRTTANPSP